VTIAQELSKKVKKREMFLGCGFKGRQAKNAGVADY
jgi:hypothetical protein